MLLDEALQQRGEDYRQRRQAAGQGPELAPPPCGHFVSAEYEADCARFLAEAKKLARRRTEATPGSPFVAPRRS